MSVRITGDNFEITPDVRKVLERKLKHLDKYKDFITSINVTLSMDHMTQIIEAQINVPKNTIHAKAISHDMFAAIDDLMDKLERQLAKYKDKLVTHH